MEKFNDFRDMSVWQKSFVLLKDVYRITKAFPSDEKFALTDDLRIAVNSVVHNIAEGYGRYEPRGKSRFYKISQGSAYESMSQILVAEAEKYVSSEISEEIIIKYKEVIDELSA
jgi:four helix bundle protein